MRTKRVAVWRALRDDECKLIHKSEAQCWDELRERSTWYKPQEHHRWSVRSVEQEIPVVQGIAHHWTAEGGCGGVHIHWQCPFCSDEHYTDDDPHDESPVVLRAWPGNRAC